MQRRTQNTMDAESCRKRLRDEGACPICLEYFRDPVTLDCGHNFCRACITECWGESSSEAPCPQCRETVQTKRLRTNRQLANVVQIAGIPMEVAAQDQTCHSLESLRKERETILLHKTENEKESQDLLKPIAAEREKTAIVFGQMRQFLEEQESLLRTQMAEVEKEIAGRRDQHQATLSAELSSLDGLIREQEEKQQQSANEVLQNVGNSLERCKKKSFENSVAFPDALKRKIHEFSDKNPIVGHLMKQFQESLVSVLQLQRANVTLDPDTAHPHLFLSEDCKTVNHEDLPDDLLDNDVEFEVPFVLGREGFTAGKHYWEVAVENEEEWSVGVAKESLKKKRNINPWDEVNVWDFEMFEGEYSLVYLSQNLKRILVTLNYDEGQVGFFDAETGVHLYTYKGASFCGETVLPFFQVSDGGHLTVLP